MSDDLIARARAALDGVTPGEWSLIADPLEDGFECLRVSAGDACVIAGCGCCGSPFGDNMADARFIAAARSLVPDLADEIARLRAEVERLREAERTAWIAGRDAAAHCVYLARIGEADGDFRCIISNIKALTPEASHD